MVFARRKISQFLIKCPSIFKYIIFKYSCNQCDHQATVKGDLKRHIQSVHEKIKYSCNHCDQQFTAKGSLKKHIQSVHEKIKYSGSL